MVLSQLGMDLRLVLLNHGLTTIDRRWIGRGVRSGYWRLYIHNRDGATVSVRVNRVEYRLEPNRVHLVPAWLSFDHRTSQAVRQFYVSFDLVRWTAWATQMLAPEPVSLAFDPLIASAWSAVSEAYRAGAGQSSATSVRVKALVHAALAGWIDQLDGDRAMRVLQPMTGRHEVGPALSHIERHLGEPLNNDLLAELCHFSTGHFAKLFRQAVGQTPGRYIIEMRVAAAAQALAFTDRSIDEIAHSLGFGNRFYFSRAFKRIMGTSPAAYRADMRLK